MFFLIKHYSSTNCYIDSCEYRNNLRKTVAYVKTTKYDTYRPYTIVTTSFITVPRCGIEEICMLHRSYLLEEIFTTVELFLITLVRSFVST